MLNKKINNNFDSLKLKIRVEPAKSYFKKITTIRTNKKNVKAYNEKHYEKNYLVVALSSKILDREYHRGINNGTVKLLNRRLNEVFRSYLNKRITEQKLLSSEVLKAHVFNDFKFNNLVELLKGLHELELDKKYYQILYNNYNIAINRKVGSKEMLTFYQKFLEMTASSNNTFYKMLGIGYIEKHFKDVLRLELKLNRQALIKEFFSTESIKFRDLLYSNEKPLLEAIRKVRDKVTKGFLDQKRIISNNDYKLWVEEQILIANNFNLDSIKYNQKVMLGKNYIRHHDKTKAAKESLREKELKPNYLKEIERRIFIYLNKTMDNRIYCENDRAFNYVKDYKNNIDKYDVIGAYLKSFLNMGLTTKYKNDKKDTFTNKN